MMQISTDWRKTSSYTLEPMSFLPVRLSSFDTLAMAVPIEVLCKECFMREDQGTAGIVFFN